MGDRVSRRSRDWLPGLSGVAAEPAELAAGLAVETPVDAAIEPGRELLGRGAPALGLGLPPLGPLLPVDGIAGDLGAQGAPVGAVQGVDAEHLAHDVVEPLVRPGHPAGAGVGAGLLQAGRRPVWHVETYQPVVLGLGHADQLADRRGLRRPAGRAVE